MPKIVALDTARKIALTGQQTFRLERGQKGEDGRVAISISSEVEVNRGWYTEILSHDPGAVVLERAALGLSFLVNHNTNDLAGMVEDIALTDRKLRGLVRFGASERAAEIATDVTDGIRPFISVGYNILDYREEKRDGELYVIATKWEPLEVSSVPVPADPSVGVGRSADPGCANPDCTDPDCADPECQGACSVESKCAACLSNRSTNPATGRSLPTPAAPAGTTRKEILMDPETLAAAQKAAEELKRSGATSVIELRSHAVNETIETLALAQRAGLDKEATEMLRTGATGEQIRKMLLDKIMERGGNPFAGAPASITMSEREEKEYSICRAIAMQATNQNCFEREVSDTMAKTLGQEARGIFVPTNIKTRAGQDATVSTQAAGLISQYPVTFIEFLRNMAVVLKAGATFLPGCVGNIPFARQNATAGATWTGDNPGSGVGLGDPTIEVFTMSPKQLMGKRTYSKQLLVQTGGFADRYVTEDLAAVHALEIDRAAMFGLGSSNQPKGIVNFSGIGAVACGTNGAAPVWGNLVDLETAINTANALDGTLKYVTNAKGRGKLKQTLVAAAAGSDMIWAKDNTINGYAALSSNQVPSNLVKGTSGAVCSAILFGNWRELLIAEWGALDLVTDPYTLADQGLIRVVSTQLCDANLRHVQSFAAILDALCG
jgi:HK97 family phage major capsid protein